MSLSWACAVLRWKHMICYPLMRWCYVWCLVVSEFVVLSLHCERRKPGQRIRIYINHTLWPRLRLENEVRVRNFHYLLILPLFSFRHMAQTPPHLPRPGLCVGVCSLLGHHALNRLGKLRPGALRHFLHIGLVAGTGLRVRPDLRRVHSVFLSHPPHRHYRLLLRHDHLQGQVLCKGDLELWRPHQKQPQPWDETHKGGWEAGGKVSEREGEGQMKSARDRK